MNCVSDKIRRHLQISEVTLDRCLQSYIACVQRCYDLSGLSMDHNWKQYIECSVKYTRGHINPVRFVAYIDRSTLHATKKILLAYIEQADDLKGCIDEINQLLYFLENSVENNKFCLGIEKTASGYQHKVYFYLPKQLDENMTKLLKHFEVNIEPEIDHHYAQAIGFTIINDSKTSTRISAKNYRVFTDFDTLSAFLIGRVTNDQLAILALGNYVELIEKIGKIGENGKAEKEGSKRSYVHINPKSDQLLLQSLNNSQIKQLYDCYICPELKGNTYISCWLDTLDHGEAINEFTLYY